jgi:hypothetical protein
VVSSALLAVLLVLALRVCSATVRPQKKLILAAVFFLVSAVGRPFRRMLRFGLCRLLGGLGVGIASMLSPFISQNIRRLI